MRFIKHLTTWLLLLTVITASGLVSAKVASGVQNLSGNLHQQNIAANALLHLAKIGISYDAASGFPLAPKSTVGGLRAAGQKDAHHIIQDAAAKNLPGYKTNSAPGVQLAGPANKIGTPHYKATQVQRQRGTGTYASERRIGYKALRRAGLSRAEARAQISHADEYFRGLGVTGSTRMRPVGNRR